MSLEIESADVIRLIQQFLKENKLTGTLRALQDETSIALNTVDSVEDFVNDVKQGRWDLVLRTVSQLTLPPSKLYDLYEQIILELMELRELGAARSLLRETDVTHSLQKDHPNRYLRLEKLMSRTIFDPREAYQGESKEKRRKAIAQALSNEVTSVPSSRLLTLLGQAIKWQQQQGILQPDMAFDLFRNSVPAARSEEDAIMEKRFASIKFPKKQHAESCVFSPDGQYLVTGSVDGIIEVWNYFSGKLRRDLKYQAEDNLMLMEDSVLCLGFSKNSEYLASGSKDGQVVIWRIQTGQIVRRFQAHSQAVTSVCFSPDGAQVLSTSFDMTIRVHGLKSGKMLKEFRGHASFVSQAVFSTDGNRVVSGDGDGAVKVWNAKTAACLLTLDMQESKVSVAPGVASIAGASIATIAHTANDDQVVVCSKSGSLALASLNGKIVRRFPVGETVALDCAMSSHGTYLYALCEDGNMYCFHTPSGELRRTIKITSAGVLGVAHHPSANIVAAYADNGEVSIWKA
ncbi:WD40 repeat-containing protein SMU1-like protein [Thamnocephalis sphaerospora]|uniref:WD40 repeat-containing protein SMU1 n=1 Tax=Thamnocephalis sphaerospora TaxID=78915 RepID=A0A4P9XSN4_9FUNG|nr:WD40 repeat-containing protein SMU1-like protein [Thamnocephalis sphaerospora]|eukprot:RKP09127.1 WD40 repeat-containing protein SMU1-like protein [Thamnocephalis sphaerospora]